MISVSHVTEISSTVHLSENPSNQIPVMIINGDQTTSGLGGDGKCPKGIYIGKAKKLVTQSDGTTMTLTVKMAAQFKDLSYVSVVKKVNGNEE